MHHGFLSNSLPNTHILPLYTFMVLLPYFNACNCGRGQHIDEKYDQYILYFLRRPCHLLGFTVKIQKVSRFRLCSLLRFTVLCCIFLY